MTQFILDFVYKTQLDAVALSCRFVLVLALDGELLSFAVSANSVDACLAAAFPSAADSQSDDGGNLLLSSFVIHSVGARTIGAQPADSYQSASVSRRALASFDAAVVFPAAL